MDQFPKTPLLINPLKFKGATAIAIFHHAIVRTNNARKKTKSNDALAIFMFEALIIDKGNLLIQDCPQKLLISWLFFFCMRKEQVRFFRDQLFNGDFFDP